MNLNGAKKARKFLRGIGMMQKLRSLKLKPKKETQPASSSSPPPPRTFSSSPTYSHKNPNVGQERVKNVTMATNIYDDFDEIDGWELHHYENREEDITFFVIDEDSYCDGTELLGDLYPRQHASECVAPEDLDKYWLYTNLSTCPGYCEYITSFEFSHARYTASWPPGNCKSFHQQPDIWYEIPINTKEKFQLNSQFELEAHYTNLLTALGEVIHSIEELEFRFSSVYMADTDQLEELSRSTYGGEYLNLLSCRQHLLKEIQRIEYDARETKMENNTTNENSPPFESQFYHEGDRSQPSFLTPSPPPSPLLSPETKPSPNTRTYRAQTQVVPETPKQQLESYNEKWKDLLQHQRTSHPSSPSRPSVSLPWPTSPSSTKHESIPATASPSQLYQYRIHTFFCHAFDLVPVWNHSHDTHLISEGESGRGGEDFGLSYPGDTSTSEKITRLHGLKKQLKVETTRWHEDKLRFLVGEKDDSRDERVKIVWGVVLALKGRVEEELKKCHGEYE